MFNLNSKKLVAVLLTAALVMTIGGIGIAQQSSPFDSDGDGVPNLVDQCPQQPGSPPNGCPSNGSGSNSNTNNLSQESPPPPPSQHPNPEQPNKLFKKPPGGGFKAVGTPAMYVNGFGQTIAGVMVYGNAGLYVQGQGQIQVIEYVWTGWNWNYHDQAFRFNSGPNNWASFWFFGDYVGATPNQGGTWHALKAYIGGVATNWVYILVVGG